MQSELQLALAQMLHYQEHTSMLKENRRFSIFVIGTLVISAFALYYFWGRYHNSNPPVPPDAIARTEAELQASGSMGKPDYEKVLSLQYKAEEGKILSESEVDWLLSLASRTGTSQQETTRMLYVSMVFADGNSSTFPSSRLEKVFGFSTQAVQRPDSPVPLVTFGCIILGKLNDKRALPILTPLLSSDKAPIRREAKKAIRILGRPM